MKAVKFYATALPIAAFVWLVVHAAYGQYQLYNAGLCHEKPVGYTDREYGAYMAGKIGIDRFLIQRCDSSGRFVRAVAL